MEKQTECSKCYWSLLEVRTNKKTFFCQFLQTSTENLKIQKGECSHLELDGHKLTN